MLVCQAIIVGVKGKELEGLIAGLDTLSREQKGVMHKVISTRKQVDMRLGEVLRIFTFAVPQWYVCQCCVKNSSIKLKLA